MAVVAHLFCCLVIELSTSNAGRPSLFLATALLRRSCSVGIRNFPTKCALNQSTWKEITYVVVTKGFNPLYLLLKILVTRLQLSGSDSRVVRWICGSLSLLLRSDRHLRVEFNELFETHV